MAHNIVAVSLAPASGSPHGSVPALKVLYAKLQRFAEEHEEKHPNMPNLTFSSVDIINLALFRLLLRLTPDDPELKELQRDMQGIEDAINAAVEEIASGKRAKDSRAS